MKALNEFLNEGKHDKKIKELEKEIKSLKDENEEGFATEIENLEYELAELKESLNEGKSPAASFVLKGMDSEEDGDGKYEEYLAKALKKFPKVDKKELEKELDKYI